MSEVLKKFINETLEIMVQQYLPEDETIAKKARNYINACIENISIDDLFDNNITKKISDCLYNKIKEILPKISEPFRSRLEDLLNRQPIEGIKIGLALLVHYRESYLRKKAEELRKMLIDYIKTNGPLTERNIHSLKNIDSELLKYAEDTGFIKRASQYVIPTVKYEDEVFTVLGGLPGFLRNVILSTQNVQESTRKQYEAILKFVFGDHYDKLRRLFLEKDINLLREYLSLDAIESIGAIYMNLDSLKKIDIKTLGDLENVVKDVYVPINENNFVYSDKILIWFNKNSLEKYSNNVDMWINIANILGPSIIIYLKEEGKKRKERYLEYYREVYR